MITQNLLREASRGIKYLIIHGLSGKPKMISADECKQLYLDTESGGVWYQLDNTKFPVPIYENLAYVYPAGIIQIIFNEKDNA